MNRARHRRKNLSGFDIIEEAAQLVRTAPSATLALYYLGTVPFVLGFIFFCGDMSRSATADLHLADAAFGLAVLFVWMKFWQAIFCQRMRAHAAFESPPPWTARRCGRVLVVGTLLQPWGLFATALAALPILPAVWVYAMFQNASALNNGESSARRVLTESWRQAGLWPKQNFIVLILLAAFGVVVLLNWMTVCVALPRLANTLFGIESVFTRSGIAAFVLNSTFVAVNLGLTYLSVDPLAKTVYVLRCFYGDSVTTGGDLKAALSAAITSKSLAIVLLLSVLSRGTTFAAETSTTAPPSVSQTRPVSAADLDRALDKTIREPKYAWRLPRARNEDADKGILGRFLDRVLTMLRHWVRVVSDWLDELLRKLFHRDRGSSASDGEGEGWIVWLRVLLYGLVVMTIAAVAWLLFRTWRKRNSPTPILTQAIAPASDVSDEQVTADQQTEDAWRKLARELIERGEFRLAMRAFHLASLAHLASRQLISIARFKSNREYENELNRRAHSLPEILSTFGDNRLTFERVWYGRHTASLELVDHFATNVDRIMKIE